MKVRTEARREAILTEAKRLFMEMGYERATMGELAARLGGSKATLYGYFASKEDLFVAVVEATGETHLSEALAELQLLPTVGMEEGLARFAEKMLSLILQDEALALYRMIVGESGRSDIGDMFMQLGPKRCVEMLTAALRAAMERGDMAPGPADLLALLFLGLVRSETELLTFRRMPPKLGRDEIAAMAQRAMRMFLGGYRAVAAPAS